MANEVENYLITRTKKARGKDLIDITQDDGGGGFDSVQMSSELIEDILAEFIGLDCQTGNEGTVSMTLVVDTGVKMCPSRITIWNTAGGKGSQDIVLQIGSSSGDSDIMPATQLSGFFQDATYVHQIQGVIPPMLSSSDTYFLTLVTGSIGANVVDVRVHGTPLDV